jgi:DNA-directed RNA polymerase specialized sigma24 family protein
VEAAGNEMPGTMVRWDEIDWDRLYKILRVAAASATAGAPPTFDLGVSAEDLVQETLRAFCSSSNGLGWNPDRGPIEKFLVSVMWNKARTHLRRQKKVGGSLDDTASAPPRSTVIGPKIAATVQFEDLREKLYATVNGEADLKDLIAATDLTTGAHNVNQELAEILGKTPREVVNMKRRLLNNPEARKLLYGQ